MIYLSLCWVSLPIYYVNFYPFRVFTQSLHKMCNDWLNLPIFWVNLPIFCVVTQSLNKLRNSWENLPIYCVNLYPCHVITQSLHKMCNNWVDLHLCRVNIYPSYIYIACLHNHCICTTFQHTRGWNTGTKVCRTRCCARCRIYETPFAWFDLEHKVIPIWKSLCFRNIHLLLWRAPFRWNFGTRANKSDSLVTSTLKTEEPVFLFVS